jgi:hypothetical protein
MPWPNPRKMMMDIVPQNRAKVIRAAFFRRLRYSLR